MRYMFQWVYTADQDHHVIVAHVLVTGNNFQVVSMATNVQLKMAYTLVEVPSGVVRDLYVEKGKRLQHNFT